MTCLARKSNYCVQMEGSVHIREKLNAMSTPVELETLCGSLPSDQYKKYFGVSKCGFHVVPTPLGSKRPGLPTTLRLTSTVELKPE